MTADREEDLRRIRLALERAAGVLARFSPSRVGVRYKPHGSPVTEADIAADDVLRHELPRADEGWLSEETPDDRSRLTRQRVWIVDPLDGTREFLAGIPEWCISIGLAEDGQAVAGVAAGRFDDRAARLEQAVTLGRLDHGQADAVLHRAAGVEQLELRQDERLALLRAQIARDAAEPNQGRVAHQIEDRLGVFHQRPSIGCGFRYPCG